MFRTGLWAPHMVLTGALVPAATLLVTPALSYTGNEKCTNLTKKKKHNKLYWLRLLTCVASLKYSGYKTLFNSDRDM